jgi:hypothetical protein
VKFKVRTLTPSGSGYTHTVQYSFALLAALRAYFRMAATGSSYDHRVVHRLTSREASDPVGSLIFDKLGALDGTAAGRGSGGWGGVFKLKP